MNFKGVFTRDRRPKMAAHFLRSHWLRKQDRERAALSTEASSPMPSVSIDLPFAA
jgi:hypothetical protein